MADYSNLVYLSPLDWQYYTQGYTAQYFPGTNEAVPTTTMQPLFPDDVNIGLDQNPPWGIYFTYPTYASPSASVAFPRGQYFPITPETLPNQKVLQSASGKFSVYDGMFKSRIYNLWLGGVVDTDKRQKMYCFVHNVVKRSLRTFQFKDEAGTLYTMRFMPDIASWPMEAWLKWNINIRMYVVSKEEATE